MNTSRLVNNFAQELSRQAALLEETVVVRRLAPRVASGDLPIALGDSVELNAAWFDHENQLVGVIKTKTGVIPLPTQYILVEKDGEIVGRQTRKQACEAFVRDAKSVIGKLMQGAQQ